MSDNVEIARRISNTINTLGWQDIRNLAMSEIADEAMEKLVKILSSRPDTLTGKTAVSLAARRKAILDLFDLIEDKVRIYLPENQQGG